MAQRNGRLVMSVVMVVVAVWAAAVRAADVPLPPTVKPGTQPESIYSGRGFYEGPTWDPRTRKLYFTDVTAAKSQMMRLDAKGQATVWLDNSEGANGTELALDGRLLVAQGKGRRVLSVVIESAGPADIRVLVHSDRLNEPNDVAQAPNGDIYFSDPDFTGKRPGMVYLLNAAKELIPVVFDVQIPNGLVVSNDGQTLYVADDGPKTWRAYGIQPDGSVGPGRLFFEPPLSEDKRALPDGMTIDELGNLYFTGTGGVWVVDPFGKALGLVPVNMFCTNVTFGGDDGKTLYISGAGQVFSVATTVRGGPATRKPAPRAGADRN
ncbi:MAG: SMP-30/gluconolactonase/LRE family protein [Planctomycetaceae bacterium]